MEEITCRPARLDELDTLLEFEQGIVQAERPFNPTLKEGQINYYDLKSIITSSDAELIVAVSNEELVGSGYVKRVKSKPILKFEHHGYVGFMYVKPDFRGKGVSQKVMLELKKWAKSKGLTELRLDVYNDNAPAVNAYEKAGFEKLLVEMRLSI